MPKIIDHTGQRFVRLLVLGRNDERRWHQLMWDCLCDCGNRPTIDGYALRSGRAKSCGCFSAENGKRQWGGQISPYRKAAGMAAAKATYISSRVGALRRGYVFEITFDDFLRITKELCAYCGAEPATIARRPTMHGTYTYNGLDRADNSQGYTLGNTVACCGRCNIMKGIHSVTQFVEHCRRIVEYSDPREVRRDARTLDSVEDHANGSRPDLGRGTTAVVLAGIREPAS